jgi:hypothetical protein
VPGAASSGVRCPRCREGGFRVAGTEPGTDAGGRRKERRTAVWGAGDPRLVKVMELELGYGGKDARRRAPRERPVFHAPLPTSLTSSSIPLPPSPTPLPGWVRVPKRGRDRGTPAPSRTPQGCGPRSCLPGAAVRGAETARRAKPGAGRGAAPPSLGVLLLRFCRTLSRARSRQTGPSCSRLSLRRRLCRRQRTPRGGWKPV